MRILVTGSNGYVGKRVLGRLKKEGHDVQGFDVQAQGFDDDMTPDDWIGRYEQEVFPNGYDSIVHLGAIAQAHYRKPDIFFWNVESTKILLKHAIDWSGRFVFASTGMAIDPHNFYGWSKRCAEYVVNGWKNHCIVRLFNVFGTDPERRTPPSVADLIATDKLERIYSPYKRDYIYVDDVVNTLVKTATNNVTGLYHLGWGESYSTINLVQSYSPGCGMSLEVLPDHMVKEIIAPEPYHPDLKLTWNVVDWLRYVSPY